MERRAMTTRTLILLGLVTLTGSANAGFIVTRTPTDMMVFSTVDGAVVARYPTPAGVQSVNGLEWDGERHLINDWSGRTIWSTDDVFEDPMVEYPSPPDSRSIALLDGMLYVNSQPGVPPDSIYIVDAATGDIEARFAVPDTITTLQDLTSDGTSVWGIESRTPAKARLWRINATTGVFEESHVLDCSPCVFVFAVAWDPEIGRLWVVDNDGSVRRAHAVDPNTGLTTSTVVVQSGASDFVSTAVYRSMVTPVEETTWGRVKWRFGPDQPRSRDAR